MVCVHVRVCVCVCVCVYLCHVRAYQSYMWPSRQRSLPMVYCNISTPVLSSSFPYLGCEAVLGLGARHELAAGDVHLVTVPGVNLRGRRLASRSDGAHTNAQRCMHTRTYAYADKAMDGYTLAPKRGCGCGHRHRCGHGYGDRVWHRPAWAGRGRRSVSRPGTRQVMQTRERTCGTPRRCPRAGLPNRPIAQQTNSIVTGLQITLIRFPIRPVPAACCHSYAGERTPHGNLTHRHTKRQCSQKVDNYA